MNAVRQGDVDCQRLVEWVGFEGAGGAERGVGDAFGVDGGAGHVKVGKMACEIKSVR